MAAAAAAPVIHVTPPTASGTTTTTAPTPLVAITEDKKQSAGWLNELRAEWASEVTKMPLQRASWFQDVTAGGAAGAKHWTELRKSWRRESGEEPDEKRDLEQFAQFFVKQKELLDAKPTTNSTPTAASTAASAVTPASPAAGTGIVITPATDQKSAALASDSAAALATTPSRPHASTANPSATGGGGGVGMDDEFIFISKHFGGGGGTPAPASNTGAGSANTATTTTTTTATTTPQKAPAVAAVDTTLHPPSSPVVPGSGGAAVAVSPLAGAQPTTPAAAVASPTPSGPQAAPAKRGFFDRLFNRNLDAEKPVVIENLPWNIPPPKWSDVYAYVDRLKKSLETHERSLLKLQGEKKKVHKQMLAELDQWKRYAIDSLYSMAEIVHTNALQKLTLQLDIEFAYCEAVATRSNQMQTLLDGNKTASSSIAEDFNVFGLLKSSREIEESFCPPDLAARQEQSKRMEKDHAALEFNYLEMQKKAMKVESTKERADKILNLIHAGLKTKEECGISGESGHFYYHAYDGQRQVLFDNAMCDERTTEGQLIKKWGDLLRDSGADKVSAAAISTFLQHVTGSIYHRYKLGADTKHKEMKTTVVMCLRLYIDRLIFPRIRDVLGHLETGEEKKLDALFVLKCGWQKTLTQTQIGIEEIFQKPTDLPAASAGTKSAHAAKPTTTTAAPRHKQSDIPFGDAIHILSQIQGEVVPADAFQRLLETVRTINRQAKEYATVHHERKRQAQVAKILSTLVPGAGVASPTNSGSSAVTTPAAGAGSALSSGSSGASHITSPLSIGAPMMSAAAATAFDAPNAAASNGGGDLDFLTAALSPPSQSSSDHAPTVNGVASPASSRHGAALNPADIVSPLRVGTPAADSNDDSTIANKSTRTDTTVLSAAALSAASTSRTPRVVIGNGNSGAPPPASVAASFPFMDDDITHAFTAGVGNRTSTASGSPAPPVVAPAATGSAATDEFASALATFMSSPSSAAAAPPTPAAATTPGGNKSVSPRAAASAEEVDQTATIIVNSQTIRRPAGGAAGVDPFANFNGPSTTASTSQYRTAPAGMGRKLVELDPSALVPTFAGVGHSPTGPGGAKLKSQRSLRQVRASLAKSGSTLGAPLPTAAPPANDASAAAAVEALFGDDIPSTAATGASQPISMPPARASTVHATSAASLASGPGSSPPIGSGGSSASFVVKTKALVDPLMSAPSASPPTASSSVQSVEVTQAALAAEAGRRRSLAKSISTPSGVGMRGTAPAGALNTGAAASTLTNAMNALADLGLAPASTAAAAPQVPSAPVQAPTQAAAPSGDAAAAAAAAASGYAPVRVVVSADSLFPIVLWVVIHANLTHVHVALGHLERFLAEDQRNFGEAGMCLSLMEAAVMGVRGMTPDKFGLNPDIEAEAEKAAAAEHDARVRASELDFDAAQKAKKEKAAATAAAAAAAKAPKPKIEAPNSARGGATTTTSSASASTAASTSASSAQSLDSFASLVKQASSAMITTAASPSAASTTAPAAGSSPANPFGNATSPTAAAAAAAAASDSKSGGSGGAGPSGGSGPSGVDVPAAIPLSLSSLQRKQSVDGTATTPNGTRVRRSQSVTVPAGSVRQLQQRAKIAEALESVL